MRWAVWVELHRIKVGILRNEFGNRELQEHFRVVRAFASHPRRVRMLEQSSTCGGHGPHGALEAHPEGKMLGAEKKWWR